MKRVGRGKGLRRFGTLSFAAGFALCALAFQMSWEGMLSPGLQLAGRVFPDGIHGNWPMAYLVTFFSANWLFWSLLCWCLLETARWLAGRLR